MAKLEPTIASYLPTMGELVLIRDYVILPIMLSVAEKKRLDEDVLTLIHSDMVEVKKALKQSDIKIFDEEYAGDIIRYKYICRGYHDKFAMIRDVIKAEISIRLGRYVQRAGTKM